MRGVSWVNLGLGLWLAVSTVVLPIAGALRQNDLGVGVFAALVALWSLRAMPDNHWPAWLSLAIGLWVLFAPWALHAPPDAPVLASNALCGSVMVIFAIARAQSTPTSRAIA